MKMLLLYAYFKPEQISSSHLDHDLIEGLLAAGHTVEIVCPTPTRNVDPTVAWKKHEVLKNGRFSITRFRAPKERRNPILRALRYFFCNLRSFSVAKRISDTDAIYCNSTPPILGLVAAKLKKKKKIPFIFCVQDIFPDSLGSTGLSKEGSFLYRRGLNVANKIYDAADRIIVISEGFKKNLLAKGVPEEKLVVVPNWTDLEEIRPVSKEENRLYEEFGHPRDEFLAIYAGNFGESQGVDVILEAAKILADKPIFFVLFGGGTQYEKIHAASKSIQNVKVFPLLPAERVSEVYSLGDVDLITCKKGVGKAGLPSKTWNILACNTPIVASFDLESDLADLLRAAGCGQIVEPENPQALADALLLAMEKDEKPTCSTREFVKATVSKEICVGKYVEVVNKTAAKGAAV